MGRGFGAIRGGQERDAASGFGWGRRPCLSRGGRSTRPPSCRRRGSPRAAQRPQSGATSGCHTHFDAPAVQLAFESDYDTVLATGARRDRLDAAITAMAADSEFTPVVRRLSCLRGVSTLTSFALAIEIGDWHRFTGNTIGSFVGLVPTEYSSGASRVQGSITKTGNTHARRLPIEAAWHHRARYRAGATMLARWDLASPAARARGDDGNRRLHARWARFDERHKRAVIANVAVARELAGWCWCWSLAVLQENTAMAH